MKKLLLLLTLVINTITNTMHCSDYPGAFDIGFPLSSSSSSSTGVVLPTLSRQAQREPDLPISPEQEGLIASLKEQENEMGESPKQKRIEALSNFSADQLELLKSLTVDELFNIAEQSDIHNDLVRNYGEQVTSYDLSNEPEINTVLIENMAQLFPNLEKLIISAPKAESKRCIGLPIKVAEAIISKFPRLNHIEIHDCNFQLPSSETIKYLNSWKNDRLGRSFEYTIR